VNDNGPQDSILGTIVFVILLLLFMGFVPMIMGVTSPWWGG